MVFINIGLKPSNSNFSYYSEIFSSSVSRWSFKVPGTFVKSTLLFAASTSSQILSEFSSVVSLLIITK